jgi:ferredoxin
LEQVDHLVAEASGNNSPDALSSGPAPRVAVTLWEAGQCRDIEAYEGESLMIALKRGGLGILAVCGGKGACGTCKVAFPPEWAWRLIEAEKRELRLLAHLKADEGERLSCRITLSKELNGLEVDACE